MFFGGRQKGILHIIKKSHGTALDVLRFLLQFEEEMRVWRIIGRRKQETVAAGNEFHVNNIFQDVDRDNSKPFRPAHRKYGHISSSTVTCSLPANRNAQNISFDDIIYHLICWLWKISRRWHFPTTDDFGCVTLRAMQGSRFFSVLSYAFVVTVEVHNVTNYRIHKRK